ncbi:MAG: AraC family transcriptional regulator [Mesorhizobium sp.]
MSEQPDTLTTALAPELSEQIRWIVSEFKVDILTAINWRIAAPWSLASRRVNDSFFLFPAKGVVKVTSEGTVYSAAPGQFIMLRDNVEHMVELGDGCTELDMIAVHCHIKNVWKVPLLNFFVQPTGRLRGPVADLAELRSFVSVFNTDSQSGQSWGSAFLKSLLINEILDGAQLLPRDDHLDHRISKSLLKIHDFYSQDISVDSLAGESKLSLVQFRKLFRLHVGVGPKKYLIQYRLNAAKKLLQESDLSLKEIAGVVGFQSVQYFHSVFRVNFKSTPGEFRYKSKRI